MFLNILHYLNSKTYHPILVDVIERYAGKEQVHQHVRWNWTCFFFNPFDIIITNKYNDLTEWNTGKIALKLLWWSCYNNNDSCLLRCKYISTYVDSQYSRSQIYDIFIFHTFQCNSVFITIRSIFNPVMFTEKFIRLCNFRVYKFFAAVLGAVGPFCQCRGLERNYWRGKTIDKLHFQNWFKSQDFSHRNFNSDVDRSLKW